MFFRRFAAAVLTAATVGLQGGCAQTDLTSSSLESRIAGLSHAVIGERQSPTKPMVVPERRPDRKSPMRRSSLYAMGRMYERRGETETAEKLYRQCVEQQPNNPATHHRLGMIAMMRGDLEQAHHHFRNATRLSPASTGLLCDIGYCCYLQRDLQRSEKALRMALARDPNHSTACNNLAQVVGELGRHDEALALWKQVNSEETAYAKLAQIHSRTGQFDEAKKSFQRALAIRDQNAHDASTMMIELAQSQQLIDRSDLEQSPVQKASLTIVKEDAVRTATRPIPVQKDPAMVFHDGTLRWRILEGETQGDLQPIGTRKPVALKPENNTGLQEKQPSSDEPWPSHNPLRDGQVRLISADASLDTGPSKKALETARRADFVYPSSKSPQKIEGLGLNPFAVFDSMESGSSQGSDEVEKPRLLPPVDARPVRTRTVFDLPFVPKRGNSP